MSTADVQDDFARHDFFRSSAFVQDPYAYFDYLRGQSPVFKEPHQGVYMITGYDEILEVYNSPDTFSNCMSTTGPMVGCPIPLAGRENDDISDLIEEYREKTPFFDQLPTMDAPVHTAHRSLLMALITPKRLKENEDYMWDLANKQIDTFIDSGACEYIDAFAQPFAVLVVADLLGVPAEDRIAFRKKLLQNETEGAGVGSVEDREVEHSPLEWLYSTFSNYVEDRRLKPRSDILTGLATAKFPDGSTPDPLDVARIASNVFAAGQHTTVRLLAYSMQMMGDYPELQAKLRADRSLIPSFIEECLRTEAPAKGDFRLCKKPTTLGGVHIPAGSFLYVANAAANRDPRKFENPNEFRIDRSNVRQHVSFARGAHACPGAPLARAEGVASLNRMFDRTRDIRVSEAHHGPRDARNYNYIPTFILRGLTDIYIEFDPA